jgi:hypothetical protein
MISLNQMRDQPAQKSGRHDRQGEASDDRSPEYTKRFTMIWYTMYKHHRKNEYRADSLPPVLAHVRWEHVLALAGIPLQ